MSTHHHNSEEDTPLVQQQGDDEQHKLDEKLDWVDLPIEILELIASNLSAPDLIRCSVVCQRWRFLGSPILKPKRCPLLMYCAKNDGSCKAFDPSSGRTYTAEIELFAEVEDLPHAMRFSKDGWVIISVGSSMLFLVNPLVGRTIGPLSLPEYTNYCFDGIAFSSHPDSPDCVIFCISFNELHPSLRLYLLREEDAWETYTYEEDTRFRAAATNPVFINGCFYCLGRDGNLGVFDVAKTEWTVLNNPKGGRVAVSEKFSMQYLAESRGQLLWVSVGDARKPNVVHIFRLDWCKMRWMEVKGLEDQSLYIAHNTSLMVPAPARGMENKLYFPSLCGEDYNKRVGLCYSLESQTFHPNIYRSRTPTNCIWIEPNLSG